MGVAVANVEIALFRTRNFVFFAAVIAMNYTLMRPSPVDLLFILSFLMSLAVKQPVTRKFVALTLILAAWALSFFLASVPHLGERNVGFELLAKSFVLIIAVIGCFVAMSWHRRHFETFMRVYVVSCVIGSVLGAIGFVLRSPLLTWDDRAKGLIDDPNMYGSFLVPAVIFCIYLWERRAANRLMLAAAMPVVVLGILLSFSRIAIVAVMVCAALYVLFLNRTRLQRMVPVILGVVLLAVVLFAAASLLSSEFTDKFFERLTFAKSYDLGREGRYGRYLLVLPMILDNPMGVGVLQLEKIFPEPIHNIWLSSFVNYGWGGGFTWLILFFASIVVAIQNYRRTRDPVAVALLFGLLGIVMCASLHEGEHWRHMWLLYGVLWGFNPDNFRASAPPAAEVPAPPEKVNQTRFVRMGRHRRLAPVYGPVALPRAGSRV